MHHVMNIAAVSSIGNLISCFRACSLLFMCHLAIRPNAEVLLIELILKNVVGSTNDMSSVASLSL